MGGENILVIEDDALNRRLLEAILKRSGFGVESAASGEEGINLSLTSHPGLVLLDVMLPDIDGFEVCTRIKADYRTRDIPIIFVTSLDDLANKLRGLSAGAVDYISKPFVTEEVEARVKAHLVQRSEAERLYAVQRRKLETLRNVQESLLTDIESMPESRCEVYFESAEEGGGDQYDVIDLGDSRFGYCVSDISGHGIETVLLSTVMKALFRESAARYSSPVEVFQDINSIMSEYFTEDQFVTASYLSLDRKTGKALVLSAGHLPVIMSLPDGSVRRLEAEGDVLGAFIAPIFKPLEIEAPPGSRFWLFTDGVVEDFRERASWMQGMARMEAILPELAALPLAEARRKLTDGLFTSHPGQDDRLLLACEL